MSKDSGKVVLRFHAWGDDTKRERTSTKLRKDNQNARQPESMTNVSYSAFFGFITVHIFPLTFLNAIISIFVTSKTFYTEIIIFKLMA